MLQYNSVVMLYVYHGISTVWLKVSIMSALVVTQSEDSSTDQLILHEKMTTNTTCSTCLPVTGF